jgi:hypothetical protein
MCVTAHAHQDAWLLTTADFRTERVSLRGIDEDGASVLGVDGAARRVSFDRFLQLERVSLPRAASGKFILVLAGGDRLAGEPRGVDAEMLAWNGSSLGQLKIPLSRIVSMSRPGPGAQVTRAGATEDVVTLVNGDTVRGILSSISPTAVSMQGTGGEVTDVPLESVLSVEFASTAPAPAASGRAFRITLADGSAATAQSIRLAGGPVVIALADGTSRSVPLAEIVSIEQLNGPVLWLSSLAPVQNVQIPFVGQSAAAKMNQGVSGRPIRFGDRNFARGIGVHSYSRLVWEVGPAVRAFRTQYAVDGDLPYANVAVRIRLDDRIVYEQTDFRAGSLSPVVLLDIDGQSQLTLEVDYGQNFDVQDRFNWIEPALLKIRPPPASAPVPTTQTGG